MFLLCPNVHNTIFIFNIFKNQEFLFDKLHEITEISEKRWVLKKHTSRCEITHLFVFRLSLSFIYLHSALVPSYHKNFSFQSSLWTILSNVVTAVMGDAQWVQKTSYSERNILKMQLLCIGIRLPAHARAPVCARMCAQRIVWLRRRLLFFGCWVVTSATSLLFSVSHVRRTVFQGEPLVLVTELSQAVAWKMWGGERKPQHLFQRTITSTSAACL